MGDIFNVGFKAKSITGQKVTGVVCGGFMKGKTVRVF